MLADSFSQRSEADCQLFKTEGVQPLRNDCRLDQHIVMSKFPGLKTAEGKGQAAGKKPVGSVVFGQSPNERVMRASTDPE